MIIEKKQQHEIAGDDFATIESKVNNKKLAKLYGMLSDIYRNPIGSIVREYASNAYDANIEAKQFAELDYKTLCAKYSWMVSDEQPALNLTETQVNELKSNLIRVGEKEPIIVGIDESEDLCFYVRDYGIGLSPERMQHIYFNYLDSTKEENNDEIGGFGIGAKSALAYTHTFFITTVYCGTEYQYIMTKNAEGIPIGQLLDETKNCGKANGTLIKIPLKEQDTNKFITEICKQLSYMDNVYFSNKDYRDYGDYDKLFNDSKVISGPNYRYNSTKHREINEMHLCLENVTYTLDWTELGMSAINVPIALTFKTGELQPTPSRESIVYTKHSIELIQERIKTFVLDIVDKYNALHENTMDFKYWVENRYNNKDKKYVLYSFDDPYRADVEIDMKQLLNNAVFYSYSNLKSVSYKPFADLGISNSRVPHDLYFDYRVSRHVSASGGKSKGVYNSVNTVLSYNKFVLYKSGTESNSKKNYYILEKLLDCKHDFYFLRSNKPTLKKYIQELSLKSYPVEKWRDVIKVFQDTISGQILSKSLGFYEQIYINPNWEADFKSGNSVYSPPSAKSRNEGSIYTKEFSYNSWDKVDMKLSDIESYKGIFIYNHHDDKDTLENVYKMINRVTSFHYKNSSTVKDKACKVISVSNRNCKILKEMENTFTPDEFLRSNIRTVRRVVTTYIIKERCDKFSHFQYFEEINKDLYDKYYTLRNYIDNNREHNNRWESKLSDSFVEGMVEICQKTKNIDHNIIKITDELENYSDEYPFIQIVNYGYDPSPKIIGKTLKQLGAKVNNSYYLKSSEQLLADLITKRNDNS